jgi:hypothetical protein
MEAVLRTQIGPRSRPCAVCRAAGGLVVCVVAAAVNSSSNPSRRANCFGYKLAVPSCLTAALRATSVIPNNSKVFAGANLSGWRVGFAGVRAQPPGFRPDPKFSLANSPVSPLDRLRLLTAPSNAGGQTVLFKLGTFMAAVRRQCNGARNDHRIPADSVRVRSASGSGSEALPGFSD